MKKMDVAQKIGILISKNSFRWQIERRLILFMYIFHENESLIPKNVKFQTIVTLACIQVFLFKKKLEYYILVFY